MNNIKGYLQLGKGKSDDIFNFNFVKYGEKRFEKEILSKIPKFKREYNKLLKKYKTQPRVTKFYMDMLYKGKEYLGGCSLNQKTITNSNTNMTGFFEMLLRVSLQQVEATITGLEGKKQKKRKLGVIPIKG